MADGRAMQIVNFDHKNKADLNYKAVEQIIQSRRLDDTKTIAISIGGVARSGKSFLLNLFVNFLSYAEKNGSADGWENSNGAVEGINWAQSRTAVTLGIWMWNKPYIIKRTDGTKVAVLLVDSQGTGDNKRSDPKLDTLIMYISLQLASFQLINIRSYLTSTELTSLQLCTDYAEIGRGDNSSSQRGLSTQDFLFNSLIFAVRDCQDRRKFGEDAELFNEIHKECVNDHIRRAVQGIEQAFCHITTFTFPHPGPEITNASEAQRCTLREIPKDFIDSTKELCMKVFCSNRLRSQEISTGSELLLNFEALKLRLESTDLPEIGTPADALGETILYRAYSKGQSFYKVLLSEQEFMSIETEEELREAIETLQLLAMETFQSESHQEKYGHSPIWRKYEELFTSKFSEDQEVILAQYRHKKEIVNLEKRNQEERRRLEEQEQKFTMQIARLEGDSHKIQERLEQEKVRSEEKEREHQRMLNKAKQDMENARSADKEQYQREVERHQRMIEQEKKSREKAEQQRQQEMRTLNGNMERMAKEQQERETEYKNERQELQRQLQELRSRPTPQPPTVSKKKKGGCSVM